jgi:hypothetical protein
MSVSELLLFKQAGDDDKQERQAKLIQKHRSEHAVQVLSSVLPFKRAVVWPGILPPPLTDGITNHLMISSRIDKTL